MEPKTSSNAEILVQGSCFFADKERMGSKSNYLKRLFELESSRITISPPLNITAQTFEFIVGYCYGGSIVITPINVAALRIAAELLEMSTGEDGAKGDNLCQKTEDYFKKAIDVNRKFVVMILQSCLSQMPEAETTANLVSKCIEALASKVDEGESIVNYLQDIKTVSYKDFELIAESLYKKLTGTAGQDLLYQIIDFYFEEHSGNVTDEQKTRICNYIDCKILSPQLLMHAVQNQRLPIRFVIKAVHIERLKAGGTIVSAANNHDSEKTECETADAHTLGALLFKPLVDC
ncbi:BTB/POZ domain-containing protein At3g49900-like [Apium graveolens]|uniref:BTB/POZ domain-containing protein At3g49900-like n=1 Tax=Apium graveolens TaxID=4045 RepID=UPI003D7BD0C7